MVPEDAVEAPGGVRAWSADAAAGLVGEPVGAEECSTWCLDGLDGRDWLTPSP